LGIAVSLSNSYLTENCENLYIEINVQRDKNIDDKHDKNTVLQKCLAFASSWMTLGTAALQLL